MRDSLGSRESLRSDLRMSPFRTVAAYYLVFLPAQFICGFVEGAARGDWRFTLVDLSDQFGGYVVYEGMWMALTGILVVPALLYLDRRLFSRLSTRRRLAGFIVAAPATVLICGVAASFISRGSVALAVFVPLAFPWSFAISNLLLGALAGSWTRATPRPSAAAA
jgi:hypothetical protein